MKRFFFQNDQRDGDDVILSVQESHHIQRVLRLKVGDEVELYDGSGTIYCAEIVSGGQSVTLKITSTFMAEADGCRIHVGQGIIKVKKMELLLQKCTELGVHSMFPFISSRCQGNMVHQFRGKGSRWQKIIDEACKQCNRPTAMKLEDILDYKDALHQTEKMDKVIKLFFWEQRRQQTMSTLAADMQQSHDVILLFGPEGGFTENEAELATAKGWHIVGLGQRTLRAETAVMAGVSIVQHLLGNM